METRKYGSLFLRYYGSDLCQGMKDHPLSRESSSEESFLLACLLNDEIHTYTDRIRFFVHSAQNHRGKTLTSLTNRGSP